MNEFSELEFKYKADDIKLQDFVSLMATLPIVNQKDVSSWDHYYIGNNEDEFIRYRESTDPELTIKRKTTQNNNWQRIEIDLPLDHSRIKSETVSKWVELLNYKHKRSIYKTCFIYWTTDINFVYYIVYDTDMKEKGRFIEVEVNKYGQNPNGIHPDNMLKYGQDVLLKLGLSPQNRLKKSLFEIFVK
jgi:hypothetical protein